MRYTVYYIFQGRAARLEYAYVLFARFYQSQTSIRGNENNTILLGARRQAKRKSVCLLGDDAASCIYSRLEKSPCTTTPLYDVFQKYLTCED